MREHLGPSPRLRQPMDPELARTLAHPLRGHILLVLHERAASPVEISRETGVPLTMVSNQMSELRKRGLVELVDVRRRRGVDEHFYRAGPTFYFDDCEWGRVPGSLRSSFSTWLLRLIAEEVREAIEGKTFDARNGHLSRIAMVVDERGWRELLRVQEKAMLELMAIKEESARRMKESAEPGVAATAAMLGFERPPERVADRA